MADGDEEEDVVAPAPRRGLVTEADAKAEARAKRHVDEQLQKRKQRWAEERLVRQEQSRRRQVLADQLEQDSVSTDVKKLIAPMFHIRLVVQYLWEVLEEYHARGRSFSDALRDEGVIAELTSYRQNFQEGGEARMEELERRSRWLSQEIAQDEEKKRELVPAPIDIHTLKEVLEFGQACKFEGNERFREGEFEEALRVYSRGDEELKKWKVEPHLRNERKWLQDEHLACLKNKAQAALRLELFQTALEAAEAALSIDVEDHKAWYRKVQAEKGLGRFDVAEESLRRLEDVAQWCPDRRRILRDCEAERKRIRAAVAKHKVGTKDMLGKAFEAGVFSVDRERELEEAAIAAEAAQAAAEVPASGRRLAPLGPREQERPEALEEPLRPPERKIHLTPALAGELLDDLAVAYAQKSFQERVRKCARDSGYERSVFLMRLRDVAFQVQKPVLEKWGFEGSAQGVREMTAALRDPTASGKDVPAWLKEKQDRCLELLYGGKEGKMLEVLLR